MFKILVLFLSTVFFIMPVYPKQEEYLTKVIVKTSNILKNQVQDDPCADGSCIDYAPYIEEMQTKIKANWHPTKYFKSYKIVYFFRIRSNGEIYDIRLKKSSGSRKRDQEAKKAILTSSPLNPLPEGSLEHINIEFFFRYNLVK